MQVFHDHFFFYSLPQISSAYFSNFFSYPFDMFQFNIWLQSQPSVHPFCEFHLTCAFHFLYAVELMQYHILFCRVVQKNLVFVVGLSPRLADQEVLKKPEYFGKFGKIHKVVINQSTSYAGSQVCMQYFKPAIDKFAKDGHVSLIS